MPYNARMHSIATRASTPARRLLGLGVAGLAVSFVALIVGGTPASATTLAVTTFTDGGAGSLRDAITQANSNAGADVITLPAGTYTLSLVGTGEDANATGDLDITSDITIVGAGSASTFIDADGIDRVFDIRSGVSELQGVTIENGDVGASRGGNVAVRYLSSLTISDSVVSNGAALDGGGISSDEATLVVRRTELVGNTVVGIVGNGSVGSAISAGGNAGSLELTDSLIAGNTTTDGNGAVYLNANGTITNTTITGNESGARTVLVEAYGEGTSLVVTLTHLTIANNTTTGNLPGLALTVNRNAPALLTVTIEGSLLMNNIVGSTSSNCAVQDLGVITSGGHNLTDDNTCTSFTQTGDLTDNQETILGVLADNGGPTRTLALIEGSAIDAAGACGATTPTDQRGETRPSGAACDMGAFELLPEIVTTTTTTIAQTTTTQGSGGGAPTTLALPPTTPGPVVLPATGSTTSGSLWVGALLLVLGTIMIGVTRRSVR